MNERIKELIDQATEYNPSSGVIRFNKEKFAELIVRECAEVANKIYKNEDYDSEWDAALREAESNIKQHFGIE